MSSRESFTHYVECELFFLSLNQSTRVLAVNTCVHWSEVTIKARHYSAKYIVLFQYYINFLLAY